MWSPLNPEMTSGKTSRRSCSQSVKLTPVGLRFCGRGVFVTSTYCPFWNR